MSKWQEVDAEAFEIVLAEERSKGTLHSTVIQVRTTTVYHHGYDYRDSDWVAKKERIGKTTHYYINTTNDHSD